MEQTRQFLLQYSVNEVTDIFKDKFNCLDCPFKTIFKGKISKGGDLFRCYCGIRHVSREGINLVMFTAYTSQELETIVEKLKRNDPEAPDIVKIHPKNPNRFIISSIRVKEVDGCPVDRHNRGVELLSPQQKKIMDEWLEKFIPRAQ